MVLILGSVDWRANGHSDNPAFTTVTIDLPESHNCVPRNYLDRYVCINNTQKADMQLEHTYFKLIKLKKIIINIKGVREQILNKPELEKI